MSIITIIPNIVTENLTETVKFYTDNLFFELDQDYGTSAMLSTGDAKLFISDRSILKHLPELDKKEIGGTLMLYFKVKDINTYYEKVKSRIPIHINIHQTDYHTREFCVKDNNGYILDFGEELQTEY